MSHSMIGRRGRGLPSTHRASSTYLRVVQIQLVIIILLLFTLTGFVCTYKIQATEDECLNSNVLCYECNSRIDPNCADPFEFPYSTTFDMDGTNRNLSVSDNGSRTGNNGQQKEANITRIAKRLPSVSICHGCCVKITSKTPDGVTYVRRTCTTNIQINYFMVGLVCMKESGDRGKMCFCENDYCNGNPSNYHKTNAGLLLTISTFFYMITNIITHFPLTNFYPLGRNTCS